MSAVLLTGTLLFSGCGSTSLDTGQIEAGIKKDLSGRLDGKITQVKCPEQVELQVGSSFRCLIKAADGTEALVRVDEKDADGGVSTHLHLLDGQSVAAGVKSYAHDHLHQKISSISCPDLIIAKIGRRFKCQARSVSGKASTVIVTEKSGSRFRFKIAD